MNPFAALSTKNYDDDDDDDDDDGGGGFKKVPHTARASSAAAAAAGLKKKKKKSAADKRAALATAQEVEAARARAHALIEAREAKEREARNVGFEKVAKGSGIAKSVAKKIAKSVTKSETAAEREVEDEDDERRRRGDDGRSSGGDDSNTVVKHELDDVVKVSKVFWHAFEGGKGAWCVNCTELGEDGGHVLCMSITKIVPRVRKISKDAGEKPVLIDAEVLMIRREWNEQTKIDRARRAKAKAKAAKAAAKAAAEAGVDAPPVRVMDNVSNASVPLSSSFNEIPVQPHVAAPVARHTSTPPPGFSAPVHTPVHVVHVPVPVVDPHAEAKQRALEAQIAALQAQLASQTMVSTPRAPPPGFGTPTRPTGGKYVPPGRRAAQ